MAPRIFFKLSVYSYFSKNPQTTIALPFLTHNISAIGGVMRFRIDFNTLWYAQKTPAFPYQRRSNKPARHDFVVNGADVCKFARLKRGNALWIQNLNLVFEFLECIIKMWQSFRSRATTVDLWQARQP